MDKLGQSVKNATAATAAGRQHRRRSSLMEATGRTHSVAEDVIEAATFGFLSAPAGPSTPLGRRARSAGSFNEIFGGSGVGAVSSEDPFDTHSMPLAAPTYRPDILRTLPQQLRGFDPDRLNVTNSSNAYRGFSNLGDISFGTRGLPTGFAEAAKMDTADSGIAESLAGINGVANTNLNTFDLVDLGLTTGGYSRDRSRSPFTVGTVPRAWSDSSRPHWGSRVQFTLSAVCLACGFNCLVNVPLSAARNGGGTFLVVYACLLFLVGYPITLLLCLLGQYYQGGSFVVFASPAPIRGIAAAMVSSLVVACVLKSPAMAFALQFAYTTIAENSVHNLCEKGYGSDLMCGFNGRSMMMRGRWWDHQGGLTCDGGTCMDAIRSLPSFRYWTEVANSTQHGFRWDLVAAAVAGWALVYVCTFRRLSLFRKVILPIFVLSVTLLLALFLRSVTADRGMAAVIRNLAFRSPADPLSMITSALECVLCDSFLVSGAVVCLASFNRFNQKVHRDVLCVYAVHLLVAFAATLFHFGLIPAVAFRNHPRNPYDLAFGVVPSFLSTTDSSSGTMLPRVWAIVYFAAIALFELGQNAVILETVMASLEDLRPAMRPSRMFSLAWIVFIVIGLYTPLLASGASDAYFWFPAALSFQATTLCLLCFVLFAYGSRRLSDHLSKTIGVVVDERIIKCAVASSTCLVLVGLGCQIADLARSGLSGYPTWLINLGLVIAALLVVQIPGYALYRVYRARPRCLDDLTVLFRVPEPKRYAPVREKRGGGGGKRRPASTSGVPKVVFNRSSSFVRKQLEAGFGDGSDTTPPRATSRVILRTLSPRDL